VIVRVPEKRCNILREAIGDGFPHGFYGRKSGVASDHMDMLAAWRPAGRGCSTEHGEGRASDRCGEVSYPAVIADIKAGGGKLFGYGAQVKVTKNGLPFQGGGVHFVQVVLAFSKEPGYRKALLSQFLCDI
jgi:hypothetical protein